jgi:hypothetical protein
MDESSEWVATIRVERDAAPSGDVIFVSTDSGGSPGGLKSAVLRKLGLTDDVIPPNEMNLLSPA